MSSSDESNAEDEAEYDGKVDHLAYAHQVLAKTRKKFRTIQNKMIKAQSRIRECEESVRRIESSPTFIPQNIHEIKQYDFHILA
jgi:hypothetical protein